MVQNFDMKVDVFIAYLLYYDLIGINFLALAGGKYTSISVQRSSIFSSIGIIGSDLPIQKSCKPVLAASGTGFFIYRALRCL
jgi:hypothetical protein